VQPVAIIGAGLVGRGWAIAFARAGHEVRLWDPVPDAAAKSRDQALDQLPELERAGLLRGRGADEVSRLLRPVAGLADALADVCHVQESAPEDLDTKIALFAELDALTPAGAVIASSTSALLPSAFSAAVPGRERCLVAHPVNPPHLVPLVEIVPAPWTLPSAVERTEALMRAAGQSPVVLRREIDGFVLNRLQAAVLDEAFRLVDGGYAEPAAVDACMRDGLALRWVFMGPFETIDLNAPGGVRDYVARYQAMFRRMTETMRESADWAGAVLDRIEQDRRQEVPAAKLAARHDWRDRKLIAVAGFRQAELTDEKG